MGILLICQEFVILTLIAEMNFVDNQTKLNIRSDIQKRNSCELIKNSVNSKFDLILIFLKNITISNHRVINVIISVAG